MESMADGVLLVRRELGHSPARRIDRQEQRVVAKTMVAATLVRDNTLAGAFAIGNQAVRIDKRNDAHKARGTVLVGHALQVHEQLGVVGGIVAVDARVARAIHARFTVQDVDDQARIVSDGHEPRLLDGSLRLDDGVLQKRRAVFLGVLKIAQLAERHKTNLGHDLAQNGLDLGELMSIAGCHDDGRRRVEGVDVDLLKCHEWSPYLYSNAAPRAARASASPLSIDGSLILRRFPR